MTIIAVKMFQQLSIDQLPVGLIAQLVDSRSSLNFFQVSSFQLLKLKHLHCDDLHIMLPILKKSKFLFAYDSPYLA